MSFYRDYIDRAEPLIAKAIRELQLVKMTNIPMETQIQAAIELDVLNKNIVMMKAAKIIKMPDRQLHEFLSVKTVEGQDYSQMRLPFPSIYLDVNPPLNIRDYYDDIEKRYVPDVLIHGVLIHEFSPQISSVYIAGKGEIDVPKDMKFVRSFRVAMFVPVEKHWDNTFTATFGVTPENTIVAPAQSQLDPNTTAMHAHFIRMSIHVMNYLTSPSVVMEKKSHSAALQKSRMKKGKQPLPDWYEITYAKTRHEVPQTTGLGSHHTFRYDVRGHFKHVKRGRLQGRVVWCPAHQRGLANDTYRPKGYVVK